MFTEGFRSGNIDSQGEFSAFNGKVATAAPVMFPIGIISKGKTMQKYHTGSSHR
jgi:hypothetical protein